MQLDVRSSLRSNLSRCVVVRGSAYNLQYETLQSHPLATSSVMPNLNGSAWDAPLGEIQRGSCRGRHAFMMQYTLQSSDLKHGVSCVVLYWKYRRRRTRLQVYLRSPSVAAHVRHVFKHSEDSQPHGGKIDIVAHTVDDLNKQRTQLQRYL